MRLLSELHFVEVPVEYGDKSMLILRDRKSTRLNSSHANISYAVFCLKKKKHSTYYPDLLRPPVCLADVLLYHRRSARTPPPHYLIVLPRPCVPVPSFFIFTASS